jgi:mannosyltransferase OCH1-like enzyme
MPIPKYIHQLAPDEKDDWHPLWHHCRESWLHKFKSVSFIMWSDSEAEQLVKTHYPYYYHLYMNFPFHINRIDFVRFCILHQYGGIYADMDMFCYEDFYHELTEDLYLVGSLMHKEVVQNSLMASTPKQEFFIECMNKCKDAFDSNMHSYDASNITTRESNDYILNVTGPRLLSEAYAATNSKVSILPAETYNPNYLTYNSNLRTKHMLTGRWGTEMMHIKKIEHEQHVDSISHQDYLKKDYEGFRNVNVDSFDFNKNYLL